MKNKKIAKNIRNHKCEKVSVYRFFSSTICSTAILITTTSYASPCIPTNSSQKVWLTCTDTKGMLNCTGDRNFKILGDAKVAANLENEIKAKGITPITTDSKQIASLLASMDNQIKQVYEKVLNDIKQGKKPTFSDLNFTNLTAQENADLRLNFTQIFTALGSSLGQHKEYIPPTLKLHNASAAQNAALNKEYKTYIEAAQASSFTPDADFGIFGVTFIIAVGGIIGWALANHENTPVETGDTGIAGQAKIPTTPLYDSCMTQSEFETIFQPNSYIPTTDMILQIRNKLKK